MQPASHFHGWSRRPPQPPLTTGFYGWWRDEPGASGDEAGCGDFPVMALLVAEIGLKAKK